MSAWYVPRVNCPNTDSCQLFPLISKPGFLRVWQINYCEADYSRCERYKRSCGGEIACGPQFTNARGQLQPGENAGLE